MSNKDKKKDNIDNIIENTFSHLKDIVDANTVIGNVINISKDIQIVPLSRISVGLVSGGGNIPKNKKCINAGSGTGFNVEPVGFIAISGMNMEFIPVRATSDIGINFIDSIVKIFERYLEKSGEGNNEEE